MVLKVGKGSLYRFSCMSVGLSYEIVDEVTGRVKGSRFDMIN